MNIMLIHGIYYRVNQYNNNIGFRIRYEEIEKICILFIIAFRHEAYHKRKMSDYGKKVRTHGRWSDT